MIKGKKIEMKIVHKNGKMLTSKEFAEISGKSEATITRLKDDLKQDFRTREMIYQNGPNVYIDRKVLRKVTSKHLFELDKKEHPEYYQENNTLKSNYISWLKELSWDMFGSVSYMKTLSSNACSDRMYKLEKQLKEKYPTSDITIFFINELNTCQKGYHTHFVLKVSPHGLFSELKGFIENKLRGGKRNSANTLLEAYDSNENGIEYIMKHFNTNRDGYDLLGSLGVSESKKETKKVA